jgi:hypothetical protein
MSLLSRMFLGSSTLPCSPLRTLFPTCVKGNLQTVTEMQPAKQRFLRIFYSSTWCCIGTCVLWGTRHRGGTFSSVLCIRSIEVSGAPFPRLYGGRFKNSGIECTIGELSTRRPGVCLSFSHHSYSEKERDQRHIKGWADH